MSSLRPGYTAALWREFLAPNRDLTILPIPVIYGKYCGTDDDAAHPPGLTPRHHGSSQVPYQAGPALREP